MKKSKELLLAVARQIPGVIYQFYARPDGKMGLYYVSSAAERIFDLKPDPEGFFERFSALVIPEYRESFMRSIKDAVREVREWKYEGILEKKDGARMWFAGNSVPEKVGDEIIFNGFIHDITERKNNEIEIEKYRSRLESLVNEKTEEIRASEIKFQTIFEDARDGIALADAAGKKLLMCNKALREMLGYEEGELKDKSVMDLHPPEDLPKVLDIFEKQAKGEMFIACNVPIMRKNGSVFYADIASSPLEIAGQKRLMGSFRDVTERRMMEERLIASESSYRAIFESASDAIIIRDINTFELVDANERACEMLCYSREDIRGLALDAFGANTGTYTAKKFRERYEKAARGEPQVFEWPAKDRFDREFWVEISVKRAIIAGQYRILSIVRDITERRQLLEQKANFMNMVSHELRTPLSAIKESISLVYEGKVGNVDAREKEMIDIAKRNVDRLARLIDEVLDLQKIDSGMMRFDPREHSIKDCIEDVHRIMASLAAKKGLSLTVVAEDKLPRIRFDRDRIMQVLTNLVSNAIKFTQSGGITIRASITGDFLRVSVEDTGAGIKPEDLPKLFQRFSQLERKPGGTGLGLAISKEIVAIHAGRMGVRSEYGKGSAFYFTLPVKDRRQ